MRPVSTKNPAKIQWGTIMEADMLQSAGTALLVILDPIRLAYLFGGVCMGLALGILPGIGGVAGLALLLPFTYNLDAPAAFALLLGMGSTTTTADPISAILFGAPGPCGLGGDRARRLPDDAPGRGRAGARRLLYVGADRRAVRRLPDGHLVAAAAADHSLHGLARAAVDRGVRHLDGVHALGQHAAARSQRSLLRPDAGDGRHRSAVGNAALDDGYPLSVGRAAAGAGDARHLCAAGAVRPGDRTHGGGRGRQDDRHQDRHAAGRQGLPDGTGS